MIGPITIILPWPESALSPNSRDRWGKIKAAKFARQTGKITILRAGYCSTPSDPVFTFDAPTHRHYDLDGLVTRCKNYQDGIFDALNNNDNQIEVIEARIKDVCAGGSVTITISEVDDD
jgi:hypothetical protein